MSDNKKPAEVAQSGSGTDETAATDVMWQDCVIFDDTSHLFS